MSDTDAARDPLPGSDANAVPKHTTPTWEMELLVSGATTFGLLQLPPLLDRTFFRLMNGAILDFAELLKFLWVYSKVALITLILTFIAHLFLRGYWVALVGMNSVYPGGVRWDRLRMGPIAQRTSVAGVGMDAAIELADNRATRVFGTGFGLALLMLVPVVIMAFGLGGAFAARALSLPVTIPVAFTVAFLVLIVPRALAMGIDRRMGERLRADSLLGRAVSAVLRGYRSVGMDRRNNLPIALYISHEGQLRMVLTVLLVMIPVLALVMLPVTSQDQGAIFADRTLLASGSSAHPAFYADSGVDRTAQTPRPWIDARVASGPYLGVFVPFIPRLHVRAMRQACPGVLAPDELGDATPPPKPASADAGAAAAPPRTALDCLALLSDIRVDGIAQTPSFAVASDPQTLQRGVLAMLPVGGLAAGRHEVSIMGPGNVPGVSPDRDRYRIAFWK